MQELNIDAGTRWRWMTDIHLEFLSDADLDAFLSKIGMISADGLLISGDVGTGTDVDRFLVRLSEAFPGPICFVLGNHDFYDRSSALRK